MAHGGPFQTICRRRFPLAWLAAAGSLGILLGEFWSAGFAWFAGAALLFGGVALARTPNIGPITVAVVFAFAAAHTARVGDPVARVFWKLLEEEAPRVVVVEGLVLNQPRGNGRTLPAYVQVERLGFGLPERGHEVEGVREPIVVRWPARVPVAQGAEVRVIGSLRSVPGPRNPGTFDARAWLFRRGLALELVVSHDRDVVVLSQPKPDVLGGLLEAARKRVRELLAVGVEDSPETLNILRGIMLGDVGEAPEEWLDQVRASGLMHLFAVSGLNVGMVAAIGWLLVGTLPLPRWVAALLIFGLVFTYAAITGFSASVVRATIMIAALLMGEVVLRRAFLVNSIAGAAVVVLLLNTNELFQIGFQLSFGVVLSIAFLAGWCAPRLIAKMKPDPFLPRRLFTPVERFRAWSAVYLGEMSATTLAAWLGSMPLIFLHFHMVSPVALLANLPAVPIGFLILCFALLAVFGGLIYLPLAGVFNNASWLMTQLLLGIVALANSVPLGHWYAAVPPIRSNDFVCEVTVFDLQEGQSALIRTKTEVWLIDCGEAASAEYVLVPSLRSQGINRLDGVVLTHRDQAHVGGFPMIERVFRPKRVVEGGAREELKLGDGMKLSIFPAKARPLTRAADDLCPILLLQAGAWRGLFLGDAGFETTVGWVESGLDLGADLLVADGHVRDPVDVGWLDSVVEPQLRIRRGVEAECDLSRDGAVRLQVFSHEIDVETVASNRRFRLVRQSER